MRRKNHTTQRMYVSSCRGSVTSLFNIAYSRLLLARCSGLVLYHSQVYAERLFRLCYSKYYFLDLRKIVSNCKLKIEFRVLWWNHEMQHWSHFNIDWLFQFWFFFAWFMNINYCFLEHFPNTPENFICRKTKNGNRYVSASCSDATRLCVA